MAANRLAAAGQSARSGAHQHTRELCTGNTTGLRCLKIPEKELCDAETRRDKRLLTAWACAADSQVESQLGQLLAAGNKMVLRGSRTARLIYRRAAGDDPPSTPQPVAEPPCDRLFFLFLSWHNASRENFRSRRFSSVWLCGGLCALRHLLSIRTRTHNDLGDFRQLLH